MGIQLESKIEATVHLVLTEGEARALDALVGYEINGFLKIFYEHMGEHYLKPYERHFKQLVSSVRIQVKPVLARVDRARKVFEKRD